MIEGLKLLLNAIEELDVKTFEKNLLTVARLVADSLEESN